MSVIRFGPYIEKLISVDAAGRHRITGHYPKSPYEILHAIYSVADDDAGKWSRNLIGVANAVIDDVENHLLGRERPVDKWMHLKDAFTDHDFVERNFDRECNPRFPHRLAVDAVVNKAGNLSVTISPRCLSQRGLLEKAPEWRQEFGLYIKGPSHFMGRPGNEVLYVRGVDGVINCKKPLSKMSEGERLWRKAVAEAINFSFWVEIERLRINYEVHLGNYVVFCDEDPAADLGATLEIVDAVREHRDAIEEHVKTFKDHTGYEIEEFLKVCEEHKVGLSFDRCSKLLRLQDGPGRSLTPSVVRGHYDVLRAAIDYGILR